MGKFLSDSQYSFTLETYTNGTPAPSVVTKEVDMVVTAPFLMDRPDFSKTEVVKAYLHTIVAPAMDYWKQTIEGKKALERGSAGANEDSAYFQPVACLGQQDLGV